MNWIIESMNRNLNNKLILEARRTMYNFLMNGDLEYSKRTNHMDL